MLSLALIPVALVPSTRGGRMGRARLSVYHRLHEYNALLEPRGRYLR